MMILNILQLISVILPLFDPVAPPQDLNNSNTILDFTSCKRVEAKLPGGLSYLHFDTPRVTNMSEETLQGSPNYVWIYLTFRWVLVLSRIRKQGHDLVIDNESKGYIRFNISPQGYVRSFTFLGQLSIPFSNYSCLFGIHEKYLNRLISRFDEGVIPDFTR